MSRRQFWQLKQHFFDTTPESDFEFDNGDHISRWTTRIEEEFKARYYESVNMKSKIHYGKLVFKKASYMSFFLLTLSQIKLDDDFDEDY